MRFVIALLILAVLPAAPTDEPTLIDDLPQVRDLAAPATQVPDQGAAVNPDAGSKSPSHTRKPDSAATRPHAALQRQPDAVTVFQSSFEDADDTDFDGWPDGWQRRRGPDFPWYLEIGMHEEPAVDGDQALRIKLNGAAGAVYSPPIPVRSRFSYVFTGYLRTDGLEHDAAFFTITYFDSKDNALETFTSERITHANDWLKLQIGPMAPAANSIDHAVIGLHLEPGAKSDLVGSASFDKISLGRLPRMTLSSNRPYNVYTEAGELEVSCKVSGIFERNPLVRFEVVDIDGREVMSDEVRLTSDGPQDTASSNDEDNKNVESIGFQGSTKWKPLINEHGFYRIRCTLSGSNGLMLERELTMVLIERQENPPRGEYGWTLPNGDRPLPLSALEKLLPLVGINWVKLPMWVSDADSRRLDNLVAFAERMSARGIETVGILSEPPAEARSQFGDATKFYAADIFSTEPELWYPLLEPVMARLSLQVRWWQLGMDDDVSFVGYHNLVSAIARIKAELQRFGQEVNLGFGWRIFDQELPVKNPPWDFLALSSNPQVTEQELTQYLAALDGQRTRRWVCVEPLSSEHYSLETRAGDLINRMLAAKMAGAEAVFISDPFGTHGLMNSDGTPGEMLLPWRTTSQVLAGSEYLGSINMPQKSHNYIFTRGGEVMMVVWNDRKVSEKIYLGDNVRVTDVWGRKFTPPREGSDSVLTVGPMPRFLSGLNPAIVRWNMSLAFSKTTLPSVFGVTHENAFMVHNSFGQGVSARARLNMPESWKVVPRQIDFKMAAAEETIQPFGIALPYDASSGREPIKIDFEVSADQRYQFSVYRHIDVGEDDVVLDVATHLNDAGELEVEQLVTNKTESSVSFKCFLFVPDRRRLMSQVIRLGQDRDRKLYRLPDGKDLIGKTLWLRAEEINGNRTLNRRFVAEE